LGELAKKIKERQKNSYPTETLSTSFSILVFYIEGAAGHLCLALSTNHFILDFEEAIEFYLFSLAISFYIIAILEF
jgi:hypothetical protein